MTYKEKIRRELETSPDGHTCRELMVFIKIGHLDERNKSNRQIMATISGILNKMWKAGEVYINHNRKGPRGGAVYKLDKILD